MFEQGDCIVYGNAGVCRVKEVAKKRFGEEERLYYTLEPMFQKDGVIYTPAENPRVFMRPIMSRGEAEELIQRIPELKEAVQETSGETGAARGQSVQRYADVIAQHDSAALVELTMQLYEKKENAEKRNRKLWQVEEKYMKRAELLLFGELAAALDLPLDSVQPYISRALSEQVAEG